MNRGLYTPNNNDRGNSARKSQNIPPAPSAYEYKENRSERIEEQKKDFAGSILGNNYGGFFRSLFKMIPSGIYDSNTKKLFGILAAEDLLLIALILMIADSDDNEDMALLIALVYIFLS